MKTDHTEPAPTASASSVQAHTDASLDRPTRWFDASTTDSLRTSVLGWGAGHRRDLPWRASRDPWEILVAEVMLQQTQVGRVLDRWPRFIERFPTLADCAAAPLADVLIEWQGLGFPRRAQHLHRTATEVVRLGGFPSDLDGLLRLPGVGPYTARAVMAFAYERDAAVVDTNVARILSRLVGRSLRRKVAQELADELLPPGRAWEWNQTMMDIGSQYCRPVPRCSDCPLLSWCLWAGDPAEPDPATTTALVSKAQPRFEGSDRQARGRLLRALSLGELEMSEVAHVMGRSDLDARRLVDGLANEGLVSVDNGSVRLGS